MAITGGYVPPAEGAAFGIPGTPPTGTVTAPVAAQPVGPLPGSGGVTRDGAYTYTLPIDVLPGRAEMHPSVSLRYHSRGGSGLLGMGWSLSASTSSIRRCSKNMASGFRRTTNDLRIKQTDGVQFNSSDQLCLDGQKLEVTSGTSGQGGSEYRTEVDSFVKIVATGSSSAEPSTFKVYHKNGLIGTYTKHGGGSSTGFFRNVGAGSTVTLMWMQTKLEDRSGNAVDYMWTKENATSATQPQSEPRLTDIRYTTCVVGSNATCPYGTTGVRRVKFNYDTRADTQLSYGNGVRFDAAHRLASIDVFGDGASSTPNWTYTLGYKYSAFTGRSLLESVQRCAGSACQPATTFTWQDAGKTTWTLNAGSSLKTPLVIPGQTGVTGTEINASEVAFTLLDANGDGNLDIIYKSWPAGAINAGKLRGTSNTMGVGPIDYLAMGSGGYFAAPVAIDLEGDGAPAASTRCVASPPASALQGEIADLSSAIVIDMDMDGRDELFAPLNMGCPFRWTSTSGGVSTGVRITPALRAAPNEPATLDHRVWKVLNLSRTTGLMTERAGPLPFVGWSHWERTKYSFADMTGGGFPDLIYGATEFASDAVFVRWGAHAIGSGTATSEATEPEATYNNPSGAPSGGYDTLMRFSWQPNATSVRTPTVLRLLDENGDGRNEIKQHTYDKAERGFGTNELGTQAVRTYVSGSTSWTQPQNFDGTGGAPPNQWPAYPGSSSFASSYTPWLYADVNGDGLKDALHAKLNPTTSKYEWFFKLNNGVPAYAADVAIGNINTLDGYGRLLQVSTTGGVLKMPQDSGLRIADMNGDGRDDLVLLDTPAATGSVMYSNGNGFAAPVNLPARGTGAIERLEHTGNMIVWRAVQLADVDGDGLTDVVEWVKDPADATRRMLVVLSHRQMSQKTFDVITDVRDALSTNPAESVSYGKLSDPSVHLTDAIPRFNGATRISPPCRYPARCTSRGTVVRRHQNFRSSRNVDTELEYTGSRIDVAGRGSLGFREVDIIDNVTGVRTTRTYDQKAVDVLFQAHFYPGLSTPAKSVTYNLYPPDNSLTDIDEEGLRTTTTWTPTYATFAGTTAMPLRTTRVVEEVVLADFNRLGFTAVDRSRRTVDTSYDVDGSITTTSDTVVDLGTIGDTSAPIANVTTSRTVSNTYVPADYTNWLIGLTSETNVTYTSNEAQCTGVANCASVSQRATFEYEAAARKLLEKVHREPTGGATNRLSTTYERDGAGLVRRVRVRDDQGEERVSDVDFESNGMFPGAMRNAMGHVTWLRYNVPLGLPDTITDPNGDYVTNTYDTLGRIRTIERSDNYWTTYSYASSADGADNIHSVAINQQWGHPSKRAFFDSRGRPTLVVMPAFQAATGEPTAATSIATQYDALGNSVLSSFKQQNLTWSQVLSAAAATLRTGHAGAQTIRAARYDLFNRPATDTVGDPNKTGSTEGAGEVTAISYPRFGEIISVDLMGQRRRVLKDARGNTRRIYHSKDGVSGPSMHISQSYDALGNLIFVKANEAAAELFRYDAFGRVSSWIMGGSAQARTFEYSAFDELVRTTESSELAVNITYDALGRPLTRIEEGSSNAAETSIAYEWDTGLLVNGTGPVAIGKLGKAIVGNGHETEYGYQISAGAKPYTVMHKFEDGHQLQIDFIHTAGRLSRIIYPYFTYNGAQVPGLDISYKYSSSGHLRQVTDLSANPAAPLWTVTARHPLGMVTEAKTGVTDAALNKGFTNFWVYEDNTLRDEQQILVNPQGFVAKVLSYSYHPNGLFATRDFNTSITETYGYTGVGYRLSDYTRTGAPGWNNVEVDAEYKYKPSGDITRIITAVDNSPDWNTVSTTLPSEAVFAYGGNSTPAGGVSAGYTDLLLSIGGSTGFRYGYDFAGRQVQQNFNGEVTRKIQNYNTFNLPTVISQYSGGTSPSAVTTLAYDAHGTRVTKKKLTTLTTSPTPMEESVWYIGKLFEAQDFKDLNRPAGAPGYDVRRSVFRIFGDGELVAEVERDWTTGQKKTHYFMLDHQGSVVYRTEGAVDGTSGSGEMRGYFPFGKRWATVGEKPAFSSIGYTGHLHDDDLGLINMNGRLYDTEQRRFISRDPILVPDALGGSNAYSYCLNDPMDLVDPTGFQWSTTTTCSCTEIQGPGEPIHVWCDCGSAGAGSPEELGFGPNLGPCLGAVCPLSQLLAMPSALGAVTNSIFGGPAGGPGTGLDESGNGQCIGECYDQYGEASTGAPPAPGAAAPTGSGAAGSGPPLASDTDFIDPGLLSNRPSYVISRTRPVAGGPPTMNGVEIQPTPEGQYGPPMTRDMYLHVVDRPLHATAQVDDLMAVFPGVGIAKYLLRGAVARVGSRPVTGLLSDVAVMSRGRVIGRGAVDLRGTLDGIKSGRIGARNVFRNREGLLPAKRAAYYEEFVHPTPGVTGVGPQRIIRGRGGELYYTPDHYKTFIPLN